MAVVTYLSYLFPDTHRLIFSLYWFTTLRMGWHMINSFLNIMIIICVITLWIMPSHSSNMSTCIFDMVKMPKSNLSRCSLKYKGSHDAHDPGNTSSRTKRSIDDLFEPIRMTVQFHDLEDHLDMAERERLKRVLVATVDKVKDIFRGIKLKLIYI